MAKKQTNQVAAAKSTAVVAFDVTADAGMGMEGATQESFAIPFLSVLQKGSPQVDEESPEFIKGAKPGMFVESISKSLFDGKAGVQIVQAAYRRVFLRWGPRGSDAGGFKGEYAPEVVAAMRERGEVVELENRLWFPLEDGTVNVKKCDLLADTRNHYIVLLTDNGPRECLLSLSSTQIKKSKQLMSMLAGVKTEKDGALVTLPTFASIISLTTVSESNDKGSWSGVVANIDGRVQDKAIYDIAKGFNKSVTAGMVKANYEQEHQETSSGGF